MYLSSLLLLFEIDWLTISLYIMAKGEVIIIIFIRRQKKLLYNIKCNIMNNIKWKIIIVRYINKKWCCLLLRCGSIMVVVLLAFVLSIRNANRGVVVCLFILLHTIYTPIIIRVLYLFYHCFVHHQKTTSFAWQPWWVREITRTKTWSQVN